MTAPKWKPNKRIDGSTEYFLFSCGRRVAIAMRRRPKNRWYWSRDEGQNWQGGFPYLVDAKRQAELYWKE